LLMSTPSDGVLFPWDDTRCAVFLMPKSYLRSILLHSLGLPEQMSLNGPFRRSQRCKIMSEIEG
jgi:hypothetical protein